MKNRSFILQTAFVGIWMLLGLMFAQAQIPSNPLSSEFKIDTIIPNLTTGTIDIHLLATDARGEKLRIDGTNTKVFELINKGKGNIDTASIEIREIDRNTDSLLTIIKTRSSRQLLTGKNERIMLTWKNLTIEKEYTPIGSFNAPEQIEGMDVDSWLNLSVVGLLAITILFIVLAQFIPIYRNAQFKKKYVVRYGDVQEEGRTRFDPITGEEFEPDDKVVVKCRRMTSLESWEYNNNQCPDYPGCMMEGDPCKDGKKNASNDQFFRQQGPYRILNWIWYGGLGGLTAFFLWAINIYAFAATDVSQLIYSTIGLNFKELILGASLGFGLVFCLSYVEEAGQSRTLSWGRIILRALLGMLVGIGIFALGNYVSKLYSLHGNLGEYVQNLPAYLLLGVCIGLILSLKSSISAARSMMGGVIASLFAFSLYFWVVKLFEAPEWGRLIGFILFGAILGALIVSVVYQKGDFALEFISPAKFQRTVPISKWLKAGLDIHIGSDPASHVFIKWQDPQVAYHHAVLSYQPGGVLLKPEADTLVNNTAVPLDKFVKLKDGDFIQLGKEGHTKMQFIEKPLDANYAEGRNIHQPSQTFSAPSYPTKSNSSIKITKRGSPYNKDT